MNPEEMTARLERELNWKYGTNFYRKSWLLPVRACLDLSFTIPTTDGRYPTNAANEIFQDMLDHFAIFQGGHGGSLDNLQLVYVNLDQWDYEELQVTVVWVFA